MRIIVPKPFHREIREVIRTALNLFVSAFGASRVRLSNLFFISILCVSISPFCERLSFLGKPTLTSIRVGSSMLVLITAVILVSQKSGWLRLSIKRFYPLIPMYALTGYLLLVTLLYGGNLQSIIYYWLYSNFVLIGIYLSRDNGDRLETFLTVICILAIGVGIFMRVVGQDALQAMGIGAVENRWGQFFQTDSIEGALDLKFFRVFSIFFDHQAFSAFLQLSAFYFRIQYEQKPKRKYLIWIVVLLFANALTLSSTGFVIVCIILLSFLRIQWLAIGGAVLGFALYYWWLVAPVTFAIVFHTGSFFMRLDFMQMMMSALSVEPHVQSSFHTFFTSDCHILWMAYQYGVLYLILTALFFITLLTSSLRSLSSFRLMAWFCLIFAISMFSNGLYQTSPPNNLLFPVILGLLLNYSKRSDLKRESVESPIAISMKRNVSSENF